MVAAQPPEHQPQGAGTHQDDEHHTGQVGGGAHHPLQHVEAQFAVERGQDHRPHGPHRGRLGGGGDPGQNRPQHRHHQQNRRQDGAHQALDETLLEDLGPLLVGKDRCPFLVETGVDEDIDQVQPHQQQSGDHRPHEQISHRHPDDVPQEHQDDGGRDDLAQGARGRDGAGGQFRVVAAFEHGGQGDQAHGHHGGADDAGRRAQQHAHDHHRRGQPAAQATEHQRHGLEQFLCQPGAFEHHPHEDEQGHGQQGEVGHDAPDAQGHQVEEVPAEAD